MPSLTKLAVDVRETVKRRITRQLVCPFLRADRRKIVHCTYHKMGTKWFTRVLCGIADHYGLRLRTVNDEGINDQALQGDVLVMNHSDVAAQAISGCIGTHMIRDPRDVVVSGYFYHLWTTEPWAHAPSPKYGGLSYQQYLAGLNQQAGLHAEIDRFADYADERQMGRWDYHSPNFLEVKYEDIFGKERVAFRRIFEHYGFTDEAIDESVEIADSFSFKKVASNDQQDGPARSHLRSGKSGQWQTVFGEEHRKHFTERIGDLLQMMGYDAC